MNNQPIKAEGPYFTIEAPDSSWQTIRDKLGLIINTVNIFRLLQSVKNDPNLTNFITEAVNILKTSRIEQSLGHADRTLYWLLDQYPDYADDIGMQLAILCHDIDRCRKKWIDSQRGVADNMEQYELSKKSHASKAAEITESIMQRHNISSGLTDRVKNIIAGHHAPNNEDTENLYFTDAIAFMEYNLPFYFEQEKFEIKGKKPGVTENKIRAILRQTINPDRKKILFKKVREFLFSYNAIYFPYRRLNSEQWEELQMLVNRILSEEENIS